MIHYFITCSHHDAFQVSAKAFSKICICYLETQKAFFVPDMHNYAYRNAHCQRVGNVTKVTVGTFKVLKLKLFKVGCNKIIILEEFCIF